jgi:hypothetical protein
MYILIADKKNLKKPCNSIKLTRWLVSTPRLFTDKKENKTFLIYKEIPMGAVAKSYMRKGS